MRIVKQGTLTIENEDFEGDQQFKKHGNLFPTTIKCIIVGPSSCGKNNDIINLIEHENDLKFENIYVYSKSLGQPKYIYLEKLLTPIKGIGYYTFSASENILHPSEK